MKEPARISRHFIEELDEVKQRLVAMGRLVEERIRLAMPALLDRDPHLTVIESEAEVDRFQVEIDDRCFTLLAPHQPRASDLRSLVAAEKVNSDLERRRRSDAPAMLDTLRRRLESGDPPRSSNLLP
jgi:phosphate transport system protein